ncbi:hypothetical protein L1987_71651 [Smallanthus sonchifolius]|uniref:Uncharacterized protein n=1 Tax=Smallanthus sonchifolius TaxID=185202 RepID=A0ACB9AXC5_9ASTR|nr:hypothetical protein L1987_71651 [Smallanthus sonchifolius]
MILHLLIFSLTLIISSPSSVQANCTRVCGGGNRDSELNQVSYPFGFSDGCEIRLNCSDAGEIRFGEYIVQNVTRDHILINFPAKCDRGYEEIGMFNNTNFAISSRNGLLLENCSLTLNDCVVSTTRLENHFNLQRCHSRSNTTVNCYSEDGPVQEEFINLETLGGAGCRNLFSSVTIDVNGSGSTAMPVSLVFQSLELGWWVRGECGCDQNAVCRNVSSKNRTLGYRCYCNEGFVGDGFSAGDGCRKAERCGASGYMSGECGGTTRVGVLIGGIIAGASLMSTMALICYCLKKRAAMRNQRLAKRQLSEATGSFNVPCYHYREIERATNSFSEKQRLGVGAYGTVYAGKLSSNEWVAVKKIRNRDTDGNNGNNQIITALKVVDFSRHHSEINLAALAIDKIGKGCVDDIIDPFLEPNRDAWTLSSIHKVAELAFRCLAFHRDMRPSMTEVADELEQIRLSGWNTMDDNVTMGSSSISSSPYNGSERSIGRTKVKKVAVIGSRRLVVPHVIPDCLKITEDEKDSSPVSVQEIWLSEQSSPSTNSLLGNVVR